VENCRQFSIIKTHGLQVIYKWICTASTSNSIYKTCLKFDMQRCCTESTFCLSLIEPLPRTIILQPVSFSSCLAVKPRGPSILPTKLNCYAHRVMLLTKQSITVNNNSKLMTRKSHNIMQQHWWCQWLWQCHWPAGALRQPPASPGCG